MLETHIFFVPTSLLLILLPVLFTLDRHVLSPIAQYPLFVFANRQDVSMLVGFEYSSLPFPLTGILHGLGKYCASIWRKVVPPLFKVILCPYSGRGSPRLILSADPFQYKFKMDLKKIYDTSPPPHKVLLKRGLQPPFAPPCNNIFHHSTNGYNPLLHHW